MFTDFTPIYPDTDPNTCSTARIDAVLWCFLHGPKARDLSACGNSIVAIFAGDWPIPSEVLRKLDRCVIKFKIRKKNSPQNKKKHYSFIK